MQARIKTDIKVICSECGNELLIIDIDTNGWENVIEVEPCKCKENETCETVQEM